MTLTLPESLRVEMVDHCLNAVPNEGCGLFAVSDSRVSKVYPTSNALASPTGFTVPPEEHFAAITDAEGFGWEIGGVFHSHPHGTAQPSMADVIAALDPEWVYVVIGLRFGPEIRAWRIRDKEMTEVPLT